MRRSSALFFAGLLAFLPVLPEAAAAPKKTENQRAAELAMKAVRLYRAGQNAEAGKLFLEAYEISKRPAQLRNAAKAYEEGGRLDVAEDLWGRYRDHPEVNRDERAEAEAHLKLIAEKRKNVEIGRAATAARDAAEQARIAAEAAKKQAEEASKQASLVQEARGETTASTTKKVEGPNVGSLAVMGGGAAAAITGGILWFVSSSQLSTLDRKIGETNAQGLIVGVSPAEVDDEVSGINSTRVLSGVLLTAGAAAIVSGVVWLVLDDS